MQWRLIINNENDAFKNMAIDKAILLSSNIPTLRLYKWNPPAISIGCFQNLDDEVDVKMCEKYKYDYIRRITGGGAVFHDKELTYSICINEDNEYIQKDLLKSYQQICGAVINGLKKLGLNSEYRYINDIKVNEKKISGSAQTRKNNKIFQHGTILIDNDSEKMFSILKVPNEKMKGKKIEEIKKIVTSINKELDKTISLDELRNAIISGFEETFNITFIKEDLTEEELNLSKRFENEFKDETWNRIR